MLFQTKVPKREKDCFEFPASHFFERSYLLLQILCCIGELRLILRKVLEEVMVQTQEICRA